MFKVMRDPKAAVEFAKQQNRVLNQIRGNVQKDFYGKEAVAEAVERQQKPVTEAIERQSAAVSEALGRQSATIEQALPPIYSMLGKLAYRSGAELSTDELLSIFSDSAVANDLAVRGIVNKYIPTLVNNILNNNKVDYSTNDAFKRLNKYIEDDKSLADDKKEFAVDLARSKIRDILDQKDIESGIIGANDVFDKLLAVTKDSLSRGGNPEDLFTSAKVDYDDIINMVKDNNLIGFINPNVMLDNRPNFEKELDKILHISALRKLGSPKAPSGSKPISMPASKMPSPSVSRPISAPISKVPSPYESEDEWGTKDEYIPHAPTPPPRTPSASRSVSRSVSREESEGEEESKVNSDDIIMKPGTAEEKPVEVKPKSNIITLDQLLAEKIPEDASTNIIKVLSTGQTATVDQSATVEGEKEAKKAAMGPGQILQEIKESGVKVNEKGYKTLWDYKIEEVVVSNDKSYYKLIRDDNSPSFAFIGYDNSALNYIKSNGEFVPITNNTLGTHFPVGVLSSPGLKALLIAKLSKKKSNKDELEIIEKNKKLIGPADVAAYYTLANNNFGNNENPITILKEGKGRSSTKKLMGKLDSIYNISRIAESLDKPKKKFIEGVINTLLMSNIRGVEKAIILIDNYSTFKLTGVNDDEHKKTIDNLRKQASDALKKKQAGGKLTKKGFKAPPNYLKKAKMNAKQPPNPGQKVFSSPQEVARRAQVLIAAIDAGNNSPWIREELSQLYDMLRTTGQISQSEYKRLQTALMK